MSVDQEIKIKGYFRDKVGHNSHHFQNQPNQVFDSLIHTGITDILHLRLIQYQCQHLNQMYMFHLLH